MTRGTIGRVAGLALLALALAAPLAAQTPEERAAREVAERWLAHLDAEEYEASWAEAGRIFQRAVSEAQWVQQATALRQQVGGIEEREYLASESATDPQGAPPGDYVNVQYRSRFGTVGQATEVVVLVREAERGWRVVGYFLQ